MMIDRRTFVAGSASLAVAPALDLLPVQLPTPETTIGRVVLLVEGWSVPDESGAASAVWLRIDRSWRTAWR
jgi:hypothetical protein